MCAFQRALAEQDAVVGDDTDRVAPDMGKAADQRLAVELFELIEFRTVDQTRDDVAHVERLASIGRYYAVNLFWRKQRLAHLAHVQGSPGRWFQRRYDAARNPYRMRIVLCVVIGDTGLPRMHVGAAK